MNRTYLIFGLILLAVIGLIILKTVDPHEFQWLPKCAIYQWTGIHCPGCGCTRAVDAILEGDFVAAFRYNPLFIIGLPLVLVLLWFRRKKENAGLKVNPTFCWVVFVILVGYMLARNLPNPENGWLAPPSKEVATDSAS